MNALLFPSHLPYLALSHIELCRSASSCFLSSVRSQSSLSFAILSIPRRATIPTEVCRYLIRHVTVPQRLPFAAALLRSACFRDGVLS